MAAIFQLVFTGIKCKCLHYISSGSQKFTVKLSNCNKLEIHAVSEMFGHAFPQINYSSSIGARDYIQESINNWYSLVLLQSLDRGHDWTIEICICEIIGRQGQYTRVFHSYNEVKTKINSLKRRNILSADPMIREAARAVTPSPLVEGDVVICILIKPQASRLDGRVTFDLFPFTYQLLGVLQ